MDKFKKIMLDLNFKKYNYPRIPITNINLKIESKIILRSNKNLMRIYALFIILGK